MIKNNIKPNTKPFCTIIVCKPCLLSRNISRNQTNNIYNNVAQLSTDGDKTTVVKQTLIYKGHGE